MDMTSKMQYGILFHYNITVSYMGILTHRFLVSPLGQIRSQSLTYYPRVHELWDTRVATLGPR